jgi:hypothetical protein
MRPSRTWKMPRNYRNITCTLPPPSSVFVDGHSRSPSPMTCLIFRTTQHSCHSTSVHQTAACTAFQLPQFPRRFARTVQLPTKHTNQFPLHALRCYPPYRPVHKHCHIRDVSLFCVATKWVVTGIHIVVTDIVCTRRTSHTLRYCHCTPLQQLK